MALFNYVVDFPLMDHEEAVLTIKLPDPGSAAFHIVDLPPGRLSDFNETDQFSRVIGNGATLKVERTIIVSQIVNVDSGNSDVKVEYFINGVRLVSTQGIQFHSNPKSIDSSPQIIVNIFFK